MNKAKRVLGLIIGVFLTLCVAGFFVSVIKGHHGSSAQTTSPYAETGSEETQPQTAGTAAPPYTSAKPTEKASTTSKANTGGTTKAGSSASGYEYAYAGFHPKTVVIDKDKWYLILVNRFYILPQDFSVSLSPAVKGVNEAYRLDSRVAPIYNRMYDDAKKDGCYLTPCSGYRTIASQKAKFESDIRKYMNPPYNRNKTEATQMAALNRQPPGCSEHNTGLAMDIANVDRSFENSKEFRWLSTHAADYGFILRYPENKTDITKVNYEPWHWRYVGVETAKDMKENHPGLCLEEYLNQVN